MLIKVVWLVITIIIWEINNATIIKPTKSAEKHVIIHKIYTPGSKKEKNLHDPYIWKNASYVANQNCKTPIVIYRVNKKKDFWFLYPIQFWVHMQWWSSFIIQCPQVLQWDTLEGLAYLQS